ncbi:MAG TPA: PP2C family protein-serine/threonine phosphatase [Candidatus Angelobacter sp.]
MSSSVFNPQAIENQPWTTPGAEFLEVVGLASSTTPEALPAVSPDEVNALYREVFEALQVPRRLSGPRRLRRGGFEIASEIFPVGHFAGDFVSVFDVGDTTFFALGDIAGKGLTAAMWFTHVMGLVRTYSASMEAPEAVLAMVNRDLCVLGSGVPLTTMVLAQLDWRRGELRYSNGGHFLPFVHRANGNVEYLSAGGPILGALPQAQFEGARLEFSPTDMLVGYSDGLIECRNRVDEEFGLERLLNHVQRSANLCAGKALFSIVGAVQDFAAGTPRSDDLTVMIVAGAEKTVISN